MDVPRERAKVVYVMGAGRSGSTILGVILGNCAGIFFAGELDKWLTRSGEPKLKDQRRIDYWASVRARIGEPDLLLGGKAHRYIERSSALFRLAHRRVRRDLLASYRRISSELYAAVAVTSGASYVVDTSHYPLRARELQALEAIDLYLILLIRDPRDVVRSFARDDVVERQFRPMTTRAYLLLTYVLSAWVFLKHPRERRMVLHYEDLLEDPTSVLSELLDRLGCRSELPQLDSLSTGIPLHGNRLLDAELVSFDRRSAERPGGRLGERLFAAILLGALSPLRPRVRVGSSGARRHSRARARAG